MGTHFRRELCIEGYYLLSGFTSEMHIKPTVCIINMLWQYRDLWWAVQWPLLTTRGSLLLTFTVLYTLHCASCSTLLVKERFIIIFKLHVSLSLSAAPCLQLRNTLNHKRSLCMTYDIIWNIISCSICYWIMHRNRWRVRGFILTLHRF